MRLIDQQFLETPYYGSRQMARYLRRHNYCVGRHRVRRLMCLMGIEAIYQRPRTSTPRPEHKIYPYLLRGLNISCPNQAWCADITYIPLPLWTGILARFCPSVYPIRWRQFFVWMLYKMPYLVMASPISLIPIKAYGSLWMGKAAGWITSSLNDFSDQ